MAVSIVGPGALYVNGLFCGHVDSMEVETNDETRSLYTLDGAIDHVVIRRTTEIRINMPEAPTLFATNSIPHPFTDTSVVVAQAPEEPEPEEPVAGKRKIKLRK